MKVFKRYFVFVLILALLTVMSSCVKNETCLSANNLFKTEIYTVNNQGDVVLYKMDSLSMTIIGREDSVLYQNAKSLSEFYIPLSDTSSSITAIISLNTETDTLTINYRPYAVFRSTECGVINRYEILGTENTQNAIWGLYIDNDQVNESEETNLLLFFRTN